MPELTNRQLAKLIREERGNLTAVAGKCGKKRTALSMRCSRNPRLKRVLDEARETVTDAIESVYIDNCLNPDPQYQPSRIKYLFSQARARGYVDKQEVELSGPGGGPVVTEVVIAQHTIAPQAGITVRQDATEAITDGPNDSIVAAQQGEIPVADTEIWRQAIERQPPYDVLPAVQPSDTVADPPSSTPLVS